MSQGISKILSEVDQLIGLQNKESVDLELGGIIYRLSTFINTTVSKGLNSTSLVQFKALKQAVVKLINSNLKVCSENINRLEELKSTLNAALEGKDKDVLKKAVASYTYSPQNNNISKGLEMLINPNEVINRSR